MKHTTRRKFLTDMGLSVGAIALGKELAQSLPSDDITQKKAYPRPASPPLPPNEVVDFRYAPPFWQSTYCFPDDPNKSLVGKNGELLYGHPGKGGEVDAFSHVVSIGISGAGVGKYLEQRLEAAGIPIVTTSLEWQELRVELISFATNHEDEGRVDNLLIQVYSRGEKDIECNPEIVVKTQQTCWLKEDDRRGEVHLEHQQGKLFLLSDTPLHQVSPSQQWRYQMKQGTAKKEKPLRYFVRFPQNGQDVDQVKGALGDIDDLLQEVRKYWQLWKPTAGKVQWNLPDTYGDFFAASIRNMIQSREIVNGKKVFQVGPTTYRGLWFIDGVFLLEAARYAGFDKEAQEGLETIWDRQDANGAFIGGAGESHWKDTPAAIYALCRQAALAQDWKFFNSMYPDAIRAVGYLQQLCDKAKDDGTSNGKYNLLPRGFGDSGIGGVRSEFTNTLWTLIGLKPLLEMADKMFLPRREQVRGLYGDLLRTFNAAAKEEIRQHPDGFSYLPMLMKEDPKWSEPDVRKQPRPQAAQIYLSQAIHPGFVIPKESNVVKGHVALMKAVTEEEVPIETGWLPNEGVWTYNAPVVAQVYLWLGMQDLARKTFIGFLNHASPLFAWREEQSLKRSSPKQYIGDMPHNWASAECVRYLRHMLILEAEDKLCLLDGVGIEDLNHGKPMSLTYSPTRWGRVSVALTPLEKNIWQIKYKREDFDERMSPKISYVEMPRELPGEYQFDKLVGAQKVYKNGPRILIDPTVLEWEATYRNFHIKWE